MTTYLRLPTLFLFAFACLSCRQETARHGTGPAVVASGPAAATTQDADADIAQARSLFRHLIQLIAANKIEEAEGLFLTSEQMSDVFPGRTPRDQLDRIVAGARQNLRQVAPTLINAQIVGEVTGGRRDELRDERQQQRPPMIEVRFVQASVRLPRGQQEVVRSGAMVRVGGEWKFAEPPLLGARGPTAVGGEGGQVIKSEPTSIAPSAR
jgi:hypothetical protein